MSNFMLDYWWLHVPNQHLKPGTQIFGHLIGEFDSFILIWQIKNKNKIRPTYPFFSEKKTMVNKIFFVPNVGYQTKAWLFLHNVIAFIQAWHTESLDRRALTASGVQTPFTLIIDEVINCYFSISTI